MWPKNVAHSLINYHSVNIATIMVLNIYVITNIQKQLLKKHPEIMSINFTNIGDTDHPTSHKVHANHDFMDVKHPRGKIN